MSEGLALFIRNRIAPMIGKSWVPFGALGSLIGTLSVCTRFGPGCGVWIQADGFRQFPTTFVFCCQ